MRQRRMIAGLALAATLLGGGGVAVAAAQPARAADATGTVFTVPAAQQAKALLSATGVCISNVNDCWRGSTGALDLWSRDIGGDRNQQFYVNFVGYLNQLHSACNVTGSWWNSYNNDGVFSFVSVVSGDRVVESGNNLILTLNTHNACWIWTPGGQLISIEASDYWNSVQSIVDVPLYTQLSLAQGLWAQWQKITV